MISIRRFTFILFTATCYYYSLYCQEVPEYVVKKISSTLKIDGKLLEPDWQAAPITDKFVTPDSGKAPRLSTQAKFLWDDTYLYIGFICEDSDIEATITKRDAALWNEEVVEIFCDPDGDGLNYFEIEVNPLGTVLDLLMNKPYSAGGRSDFKWNLNNLKSAVWINGTINNPSDIDTQWTVEIAIPFNELAFLAPKISFPPQNGDSWRILMTRYSYARDGSFEKSSWNKLNSSTFHIPSKFGRIFFSQ
jgi:hypothetical protein